MTWNEFACIDSVCFPADRFSDHEFLQIDQSDIAVSRQDEIAVGFLYYKIHDAAAHLHRFGVLPQFRHRGLGEMLLRHFIECTEAIGARHHDLWVQTDNEIAKRLYAKEGFFEKEIQAQIEIPVTKTQPSKSVSARWVRHSLIPPLRYSIEFHDRTNKRIGYCTLDPEFPGCSEFVLSDPQAHFWDAISSFSELLSKESLKLLVVDPKIVEVVCRTGGKLNYQIVRMERASLASD